MILQKYFPDWLLERRERAERALTADGEARRNLGHHQAVQESQVSVMAKELDEHVESFRSRPLDAGPYTFVRRRRAGAQGP